MGSPPFSVTAISVAGIAAAELLIMHAQSPEQLGRAIWCAHIPVFFTVVSIVGLCGFISTPGDRGLATPSAACGCSRI
jgi:hypothetical protein